jgi:hypothetical protein
MKIQLLISLLVTSFLSFAQPGKIFITVDRNINDINARAPKMSDGEILFGYSYFIDKKTTIKGYEKMRQQEIQELTLICDSIPLNLIKNSDHITSLTINNTSLVRLYCAESMDSLKTFSDLKKLNQFPKLETVTINGYNIDAQLAADSAFSVKTLFLNACNVSSISGALSAKSIYMSGVKLGDIESLRSQVDLKVLSITSSFGDSLRLDKTLIPEELILRNNRDLIRFSAPNGDVTHKLIVRSNSRLSYFEFISKRDSFSEIYYHGDRSALSGLMKTIQSAKYIREFECYSNVLSSEFTFSNDSLFIEDLLLNVGSTKTYGTLSNPEGSYISVKNFTISGAFAEVLDLSGFHGIDKLKLYTPTNVYHRDISKTLLSTRGLNHLFISGLGFGNFPSSFFVNNPELKKLEVNSTKIQNIDFGGTVMKDLHSIYLRKNKSLEHALDESYFPEGRLYIN